MIKPLTSLRMFFALFVFLSHLAFLKNDTYYADVFNNIFNEGFLGVSFFFILSGFILAYNYREKFLTGSISKKEFYISRLARVYPVHIATTVIVLLLTFIQYGQGWEYLFQHIFLMQSFFLEENIHFSLKYEVIRTSLSSINVNPFLLIKFSIVFLKSSRVFLFRTILSLEADVSPNILAK